MNDYLSALLATGFEPGLTPHAQGGLHLDALAIRPDWDEVVGDDDVDQYGSEAWRAEVNARSERCPKPTEAIPSRDFAFWIDDTLAGGEQWAAYRYLAGAPEGAILQIGGRGTGLVRWMVATGRPGILLSPFVTELEYCRVRASEAGVVNNLLTILAPAEHMPLESGSVAAAFAPGVLHHTEVHLALEEVSRVLASGGRFASWDVWNSPLYRFGIRVMGKQQDIECVPLNPRRIEKLPPELGVKVSYGGGFTRYLAAFVSRLEKRVPLAVNARLGLLDRWLCRFTPVRRLSASLVSLHGKRA